MLFATAYNVNLFSGLFYVIIIKSMTALPGFFAVVNGFGSVLMMRFAKRDAIIPGSFS